MIKIYGRITAFNVQKVLWLADELALGYELVEIGGKFGGLDTEEFTLLNPVQKIPVLIDGENSIWESHTILRYLVAKYGDINWYPDCPYKRSLYERWLDWSQTTFQPVFMSVFWRYYRMPTNKRNMDAIQHDLEKCFNCLDVVNQQLSASNYLAGNSMTLADISVGTILYRLTEQGLDVTLPEFVTRWYQSLRNRSGYKKWVMSDFSELREREDF